MRYPSLICALLMSLWPVIAGQSPVANALPGPLRVHLNEDRFDVVSSVRGLPLGVREELQTMFRRTFLDIAEPGAAFRATDIVLDPSLPTRRLVTAACSTDHCIVYYERGGIAHTWHLAVFSWTPAGTTLEWGGMAQGGLRTIAELKKTVLSGAIKPASSW